MYTTSKKENKNNKCLTSLPTEPVPVEFQSTIESAREGGWSFTFYSLRRVNRTQARRKDFEGVREGVRTFKIE